MGLGFKLSLFGCLGMFALGLYGAVKPEPKKAKGAAASASANARFEAAP
ncbi:MAG: hypothetical protein ACPGUV_09680 [Polyangiales bacterium]